MFSKHSSVAAVASAGLCAVGLCAFGAAAGEPTAAPAPTSAAQPAEAAVASPPVDPFAEAHRLVEVAADTKTNLRKSIDLYEAALGDASLAAAKRCDGYADLSRAYMRLADLENVEKAKLDLYERGQAAGQKGLDALPKCAEGLFWKTANLASWGRTRGVMNSLFILGDLRKNLARVLELQPGHKYARQTLGEIDHAVPGLAGGSDSRAEKTYLAILSDDPLFTPTMTHLARLYKDQGKDDDARKWAQKVLDTPSSSIPNDWVKFDKAEARKLLGELDK